MMMSKVYARILSIAMCKVNGCMLVSISNVGIEIHPESLNIILTLVTYINETELYQTNVKTEG